MNLVRLRGEKVVNLVGGEGNSDGPIRGERKVVDMKAQERVVAGQEGW